MSDKERPRAEDSGSGSGGGIGGGSGDDGEETTESGDPNEQNCAGCEKKGKKNMSFFRLRKGKKRKKPKGVYVNSGCWMKRAGRGCSCFNRPRTADLSGESPTTSDPNNSEFTFDMLRGLIEKNDFYSKECNPHLDADHFYVKEAENT